jgi:sulfur carrier protein ThiS
MNHPSRKPPFGKNRPANNRPAEHLCVDFFKGTKKAVVTSEKHPIGIEGDNLNPSNNLSVTALNEIHTIGKRALLSIDGQNVPHGKRWIHAVTDDRDKLNVLRPVQGSGHVSN